MNHCHTTRLVLLALVILLPVGCSVYAENNDAPEWPISQLHPSEIITARTLAEQQWPLLDIKTGEKIYYIHTHLLPNSNAEEEQRLVHVTHFRYAGNQTVRTTVDLRSATVIDVTFENNIPTALAQEETQFAMELVKQHPLFATIGDGPSEVAFDLRPLPTQQANDARSAIVIVRHGSNYANSHEMIVNLVTEEVQIRKIN